MQRKASACPPGCQHHSRISYCPRAILTKRGDAPTTFARGTPSLMPGAPKSRGVSRPRGGHRGPALARVRDARVREIGDGDASIGAQRPAPLAASKPSRLDSQCRKLVDEKHDGSHVGGFQLALPHDMPCLRVERACGTAGGADEHAAVRHNRGRIEPVPSPVVLVENAM